MAGFETKDLIKKPNVYFLIALTASLLWVAVVGLIFLPKSSAKLLKSIETYKKLDGYFNEIYTLDPARLEYAKEKASVEKFTYSIVIDRVAGKWGIRPENYNLMTQKSRKKKNRETQAATMVINKVSVTDFAQFLSELLNTWPDLSCENIKLTADKTEPDVWKVSLKLSYNFS